MAAENDPLLFPTWVQVVVTAVIAIVSAMVATATTALLVAVGITRKFSEMELAFIKGMAELKIHVDTSDSKRFHDLVNLVNIENGKLELENVELKRRVGACEQDIAVLRDFKDRIERRNENDRNATRNS